MDSGFDYGKMFTVKDALCDGTTWHVRTVPANPAVDPYFPLGQAAMSLHQERESIRVELKTLTPNLDRYEARFDAGAWESAENRFTWKVHEGRNRIEVRTVNRFGVRGPASIAEVELEN